MGSIRGLIKGRTAGQGLAPAPDKVAEPVSSGQPGDKIRLTTFVERTVDMTAKSIAGRVFPRSVQPIFSAAEMRDIIDARVEKGLHLTMGQVDGQPGFVPTDNPSESYFEKARSRNERSGAIEPGESIQAHFERKVIDQVEALAQSHKRWEKGAYSKADPGHTRPGDGERLLGYVSDYREAGMTYGSQGPQPSTTRTQDVHNVGDALVSAGFGNETELRTKLGDELRPKVDRLLRTDGVDGPKSFESAVLDDMDQRGSSSMSAVIAGYRKSGLSFDTENRDPARMFGPKVGPNAAQTARRTVQQTLSTADSDLRAAPSVVAQAEPSTSNRSSIQHGPSL